MNRSVPIGPTETNSKAAPSDWIVEAALGVLRQGEALLGSLAKTDYAEPVQPLGDASIGAHYRHCLDHFTSLLNGLNGDRIDYDDRERQTRLETDPGAALEKTRAVQNALAEIDCDWARPVQAVCRVHYGSGPSCRTGSTLARELAYVVAHAVHHYALIAVLCRWRRIAPPADFGVAPSTLAYRANSASAV